MSHIKSSGSKQPLFPGQWALVSTYIDGDDTGDIELVALKAATRGIPVEILEGRWQGQRERSLLLRGDLAAKFAATTAREFGQSCYIAVTDGRAACIDTKTDAVLEVFTALEVFDSVEQAGDNYSVTGRGLIGRLVP